MSCIKATLGFYYHLEFHSGAYAYDWMNTNYLPKMWEQLTTAYESGIREVWIANIGDIFLLEYPLCYFMDLAYDMDRYGAARPNNTEAWTSSWVRQQYGAAFEEGDLQTIHDLLDAYTLMNHNRKPEIMNSNVYHPIHFGETEQALALAKWMEQRAALLLQRCPPDWRNAFWELLYYPVTATANHHKMWLFATRNAYYAGQGRVEANWWADAVQGCILRDRELTGRYHQTGNGRFYGFGLSEHIGFQA